MDHQGKFSKAAFVRWVWPSAFGLAAVCFTLSWLGAHRAHSALFALGFFAIALRSLLKPVGASSQRQVGSSQVVGARAAALAFGFIGPILIIVGAFLQ